jgi:hypothetical protein
VDRGDVPAQTDPLGAGAAQVEVTRLGYHADARVGEDLVDALGQLPVEEGCGEAQLGGQRGDGVLPGRLVRRRPQQLDPVRRDAVLADGAGDPTDLDPQVLDRPPACQRLPTLDPSGVGGPGPLQQLLPPLAPPPTRLGAHRRTVRRWVCGSSFRGALTIDRQAGG